MGGEVICFFICSDKGLPMERKEIVRFIAGAGIAGDRYCEGNGAYSKGKRVVIRHVSLIALEAIEEVNRFLPEPFLPEETRRNILTRGIDLNTLVGKEFFVGQIRMRGVELCDPCGRPSQIAKKKGFMEAFVLKGGLRAEVLGSGAAFSGNHIREAD